MYVLTFRIAMNLDLVREVVGCTFLSFSSSLHCEFGVKIAQPKYE